MTARHVDLDAGSAVPMSDAARAAWSAAADSAWADPLRLHHGGRIARARLDAARADAAAALGCRPDELTFAPSSTAAAHHGLRGVLHGRRRRGTTLVVSAVEHSSVLHVADHHAAGGGEVVRIGVARDGRVDVDQLAQVLGERDDVAAVAVQAANGESGAVHDTAAVARLCAGADVPWVCDLTSAVGRVPLPQGWAAAWAGGHLVGGTATGVLALRRAARWRAYAPVDERVDPRAIGFEDVPGAAATATALGEVVASRPERAAHDAALVARLRTEVPASVADVEVIGPDAPGARLPHLAALSFLYVDGEALVTELDRRGWGVASGSACAATTLEPSHVLAAMGVLTHGNLRISVGTHVDDAVLDRLVVDLAEVVESVRARLGDDRP